MEILIPLFGIFMIIAVSIGPVWIRSFYATREREQMQATLRAAIEKGQPLPPEIVQALTASAPEPIRGPEGDLRRALVLIFAGGGLVILGGALYFGLGSIAGRQVGDIVGASVSGGGAIPLMIGFAYLILFFIRRNSAQSAG